MIRAVIAFCVREPLVMAVLTIVAVGFGWYATQHVPIDAIPNIGENQVIVFTAWPGRSPKDVEDQVTYPLSVAMLAVPDAESVRGKSLFGYSFVQVTFKDSAEFYWARSRVAEQLTTAGAKLPDGGRSNARARRHRTWPGSLLYARSTGGYEPCGTPHYPGFCRQI